MAETVNLGLNLLSQNQLDKDIAVNDNFSILDSLIVIKVIAFVNNYPLDCNPGYSYIVNNGNLIDDIAGYANYIIIRNFNNDGWVYIKPKNSQLAIVISENNQIYSFDTKSGWVDYKISGLTPELKATYDSSVQDSHTHSNKDVLDGVIGVNTGDETTNSIKAKRPIKTIAGKSLEGQGDVLLSKIDVSLSEVDNTSDVNKPVSNATKIALDLKSDKASTYVRSEIDVALLNKVDKINGKSLSTNDYTAIEKNKLAGIQDQATKNDTDANLKNRANHSGTQPSSTITGLSSVATSGNYNDLSNKPDLINLSGVNTINDFTIRKQNNTNEGGELRFQLPDDKGVVIMDVIKGGEYRLRIFSSISNVVQVPFEMIWNLDGTYRECWIGGKKI